jgi:RHS repeat-associated protein
MRKLLVQRISKLAISSAIVSLAFACCPLPASAQALWTHVGTATPGHATSGTTCTVTISPAPVAGNTIWVGVVAKYGGSSPTYSSVEDGNGNYFTATPDSPSYFYAYYTGSISLAYMLSAPANISSTITITLSRTVTDAACFADSFQAASGYTPIFDSDASGYGSSSSIDTPSITPTISNELFYSVANAYYDITTVGNPWVVSPDVVLGSVPADGSAAAYDLNVSSALAVNMSPGLYYGSMEGAIEAAAPSISSLSPTSGPVGTPVTIAGSTFGSSQGSSTVTFNGVAASPNSWSNTSIVAAVPLGATTGNVVVTVNGTASNGAEFTVTNITPSISFLDPTSGQAGTSVTITGSNFASSQGSSTVKFNRTTATPTSWSDTSIAVPVPAGATTGNVVVTVNSVASNGAAFTVTASSPSITGLNPTSGQAGTSVTITGSNFGSSQGSSTVTFNGAAANPTSWSDTSIVAAVPAAATTGNVVVAVGGVASNGVAFTVTTSGPTVYYYIQDTLGSTRVIADSTGTVCYDADFYPFGGERDYTDTCDPSFKFTGKERDSESNLDNFRFRYFSSQMGRFMSPDPAGLMAVDLGNPQTLNRYSYVLNNPLSFTDPFGLDCVYLNNSGTGIDQNGIDQNSSTGECGKTGGYWVNGTVTQVNIDSNATTISLTGTTNGTDQTNASYQQNAEADVSEYHDTFMNPFNHVTLGFPGQTQFGQNPQSDSQFLKAVARHGTSASVPGAIKPQVGGQLKRMARIPITGMQAQMIQNAINQSMQNPPPYTIFGQTGCDCGTWVQMMLGDAGVNSGAPAPIPDTLMNQLDQLYPQQPQQ